MNTTAIRRQTVRIAALGAIVAASALGAYAMQSSPARATVAVPAPALHFAPAPIKPGTPAVPTCSKPAPTSPAGYAAMFAALPAQQWGAGDVSISVQVGSRSVWLYGDTLSTGRFVHSTAVTQDRGCLHVSNGGAQLLPNDDASHIYWIESAAATRGGLAITARSIHLTGSGVWAFADAGFSRTAIVGLSAAGDLTFDHWLAPVISPAPNPGPMYSFGDGNAHHFGYARHTHVEAHLANGQILVTTCQNWDDRYPTFAEYRPIFSSQP
jgi:hypothetical protein